METTDIPSSGKAIASARVRPSHSPPRIILAEDDPDMRNIIAEALRKDGYAVQEAEDGGRLLVRVTARYLHPEVDVDLIISDIRMPVCTGMQILSGLRVRTGACP